VKVVTLRTVRPRIQRNLLFVELVADDGSVGLGEAFFSPAAVETYLHETVAPKLLGAQDPNPERLAMLLAPYVGYQGAGVETRGNAAVDLAVWDLLGHASGLPLAELLGGPVRDHIPVYNTCAGSDYVREDKGQSSANWGVPMQASTADRDASRYEDLQAFLHAPAALARDLWDQGLRGMKIWPFDLAAEASGGTGLSAQQLAVGLAVVEAVRAEVGLEMDLMVELHGLWNRRGATQIMQALTPLRPFWVEDPLRPDAVDALAQLAADTDVPIATGETLVGRRAFLPLLQRGAVDVVTVDLQWTGGLTEARKVACLADAFAVPIAPHDCTGPATWATCIHLTASQPNGLVQESVRAFLHSWYPQLVTGLPSVENGVVRVPTAPGHGVRLRDEQRSAAAADVRTSEL